MNEKRLKIEPPRHSKGSREEEKREPGRGRENDDFFTFFLTGKKGDYGVPGGRGQAPLSFFDALNFFLNLSLHNIRKAVPRGWPDT